MPVTGLHEKRSRVVCHLPVTNDANMRALNIIKDYLRELKVNGKGISGFTHSVARPAAYQGHWESETSGWVPDEIVVLIVDFFLEFSDVELSDRLTELREIISGAYETTGDPQEEVWIVAHPIMRHV